MSKRFFAVCVLVVVAMLWVAPAYGQESAAGPAVQSCPTCPESPADASQCGNGVCFAAPGGPVVRVCAMPARVLRHFGVWMVHHKPARRVVGWVFPRVGARRGWTP